MTSKYRGEGEDKAIARYTKWWVGKYCRLAAGRTGTEFRKVVGVRVWGNPSFVYGCAALIYEDGVEQTIYTHAYVPRKYDVEVKDD